MPTTTYPTDGTPVITLTPAEWDNLRAANALRDPDADAAERAARQAQWSADRKAYEAAQAAKAEAQAQPAPRTKADRSTARANRRNLRATLRQRATQTRAAAKIRRNGVGTLATHCVAAGLGIKEARTVASSLRKNAAKAGVTGQVGVSYTKGRARQCVRYSPAEVARIAVIYRPRKPAYKVVAARLALAA